MTETDNLFFEEYKKLDKLCSDIYNDKYGISTYIKDMEDNDYIGQKAVKSWHRVYKSLKNIRWLRSQIAHEVNTTGICTYDDIEFIQKFYNQIFASTDPISQLERLGKYNQTSSFKKVYRISSTGIIITKKHSMLIMLIFIYPRKVKTRKAQRKKL